MTTQHTPEPWGYDNQYSAGGIFKEHKSGRRYAVAAALGHVMPDGMQEANARRIVACVNACADVPTDLLETLDSQSAQSWIFDDIGQRKYAELEQQRDELQAKCDRLQFSLDKEIARIQAMWLDIKNLQNRCDELFVERAALQRICAARAECLEAVGLHADCTVQEAIAKAQGVQS